MHPEQQQAAAAPQAPALPEIVIRLQPGGGVSVSGPLDQKLVCLGMLALAENAVHNFRPNPNGLVMPPAGAMPGLRG